MSRALVFGVFGVLGGCLLANPAYDDGAEGASGSGGASAAGSSGDGPTGGAATGGVTGTSDGSGTGGDATAAATTGTATGPADTTGTSGVGSTGCGGGCVCEPGATESCYSGPPGTEGVGTCAAGERTCDASGAAWGPCAGEVTPAMDACGDGLDQDCTGEPDDDVACVDVACPKIDGLVACYSFPAGVMDVLRDGSAKQHHGAMSGVKLVPGAAGLGQAGEFGGTSLATVEEADYLSPEVMTVVAFIRPALTLNATTLFDKENQFGLFRDALGLVECVVVNDKGDSVSVQIEAPDLVWSMMACIYDGAQVKLWRYGMGLAVSASTQLTGKLPMKGTGIHVGSDAPQGDQRYLGQLDQVLLFKRALKDSELCALAGSLCQ